jgi:hypothetical protein
MNTDKSRTFIHIILDMTTSLEKPVVNLVRLYYEPKIRNIARALMEPHPGVEQITGRLCERNADGKIDKNRVSAAGLLKYYYKCADYDSERYFWEIDCPVDGCDYYTAPFKKEGNLTEYISHLNDDHLMSFYEIGETVLKLLDLLPTIAD